MHVTHARHIVMQNGLGAQGKAAVAESLKILKKYGIDPLFDRRNLVWAPNHGHPDRMAIEILEQLRRADQIGTLEAIEEALKEAAIGFISGRWK